MEGGEGMLEPLSLKEVLEARWKWQGRAGLGCPALGEG